MSLDIKIRRNRSFVGCILIIAATELNKISRSLFIALQWRSRCISSSISFDSHLVHIRLFIGVIGLLYRPLSIFKSCELIRYLAIAAVPWGQFVIPTGLYSDRSIFRQVDIPTGLFSDRSLFRQVDIPTGRYSDMSIFRHVYIPTGRYSNRSLFRQFFDVNYNGNSL